MTKEPLGIPKGSVRAAIALIVVITCCGMFVYNKETPSELTNIMSVVVGFYFGSRMSEDKR